MAKKTSLKDAAASAKGDHPTLERLMKEVGGAKDEKKVSVHIYIPKSKRSEFKIQCERHDLSMTALLEEFIDHFIAGTPDLMTFVSKHVKG